MLTFQSEAAANQVLCKWLHKEMDACAASYFAADNIVQSLAVAASLKLLSDGHREDGVTYTREDVKLTLELASRLVSRSIAMPAGNEREDLMGRITILMFRAEMLVTQTRSHCGADHVLDAIFKPDTRYAWCSFDLTIRELPLGQDASFLGRILRVCQQDPASSLCLAIYRLLFAYCDRNGNCRRSVSTLTSSAYVCSARGVWQCRRVSQVGDWHCARLAGCAA